MDVSSGRAEITTNKVPARIRDSMRTRLDHRHCMEVTLFRGATSRVQQLAESMIAEKGVRFGQINLVPIRTDSSHHSHGDDGHHHRHDTPVL